MLHGVSVAMRSAVLLVGFSVPLLVAPALAQAQQGQPGWGTPAPAPAPYPPQGYPPQGYPPQGYPQAAVVAPSAQPARRGPGPSGPLEAGILYGVAAAYGIGLGVWVDAEAGIEDPGLRVIPPLLIGAAGPVGVFFLDRPPMPEGMPAAISAGLVFGAGEGLGISGLQHTTVSEQHEWGFIGLARTVAVSSTVGGVAGYAVAYWYEPTPLGSAMFTSGMVWGAAVGGLIGYGSTGAGRGYGSSNDGAAIGGMVGYNAGAAAGLALAYFGEPSWGQLAWMWAGAGIGAVASLPVYLFYIPDSAPPAKRGMIFTGTAMGVGAIVGGILGSGRLGARFASDREAAPAAFSLLSVHPMEVPGGFGLGASGTWQ